MSARSAAPTDRVPSGIKNPVRLTSSRRRTTARRSEEHTSELQSQSNLVCRLLLEKKKKIYLYAVRACSKKLYAPRFQELHEYVVICSNPATITLGCGYSFYNASTSVCE